MARPVPTPRALALAALGLLPAALSVLAPGQAWVVLALDLALLALLGVDYARAPRAAALRLTREVEPVLSAGRAHEVRLHLELAPGARGPVRGELRDLVTPGPAVEGHRQRFELVDRLALTWRLTPATRGELQLGDTWLRLEGPWGLCARQERVATGCTVRVFPDLTALTREALALALGRDAPSRRVVRLRSDGREFESLREYREGDDRRTIDWKATARRGRALVRQYQPERNQQVVLLLDCGRHMAGEALGRRKLDHAVDAALRLARVALDQGDLVGVLAFGREVQAWLPPRRGPQQLRAIAQALARVQATLEESDVGGALDHAFARGARRSLVVVMTDLLDPEAGRALIQRLRRLVPRHLPVVASLADAALHRVAHQVPDDGVGATERYFAARLEREAEATVTRLREAGARVLRAAPADFGARAVSAYLDVKERGLL